MPKNEVEILDRRLEKLKNEYDNKKEKLNKLFEEKNKIKDLIRNIPDNLFKLIAQKSEYLIPIVQKYLDETWKSSESINWAKSIIYFPMSLVPSIYKTWNLSLKRLVAGKHLLTVSIMAAILVISIDNTKEGVSK